MVNLRTSGPEQKQQLCTLTLHCFYTLINSNDIAATMQKSLKAVLVLQDRPVHWLELFGWPVHFSARPVFLIKFQAWPVPACFAYFTPVGSPLPFINIRSSIPDHYATN